MSDIHLQFMENMAHITGIGYGAVQTCNAFY